MTNVLLWSKRELKNTKQEAWHDRSFYRVPVVGNVDPGKIHGALQRKISSEPFAQYRSISVVTDNGDGSVTVQLLYSIGD
jgi:hypothetical protein